MKGTVACPNQLRCRNRCWERSSTLWWPSTSQSWLLAVNLANAFADWWRKSASTVASSAAAGWSFDRNCMELNVFKTLKMSPVIEMIRMSTENHKSHKSLGVFFCLETSPRIHWHRHHIGVDTFQRGWQDHRYDVGNGQQWADAFIGVQSSECVVMDDQRFVDRWWLATVFFQHVPLSLQHALRT